jgi:formate dehydrogenase subunit gamma
VASFYTNFRFLPPGRHQVEVCWGPTCHVLGAMGVVDEVLKDLGLKGEGTTNDGAVSFRLNTCLGACANGPVVSVDHHLTGRMTPKRAVELVRGLKCEELSEGSGAFNL